MEADHVSILRKNLVYLKEHLEAGDALDHLYQEGVFTQSEYNRCKQAEAQRCGTLLELLMKKEGEAYKSICAFLDDAQPHIKRQLDTTANAEGATNMLFVNKLKLEREHKQAILEKEKINSDLLDNLEKLTQRLTLKEEELGEAKTAKKEEKQKHDRQLEDEKQKYEGKLKERGKEIEQLKANIGKQEEDILSLTEDRDQLNVALATEKDKYEAVSGLILPLIPDDEERNLKMNTEGDNALSEFCIFGNQPTCDHSQLMLMPCLHAACKPCIDHLTDQQNHGRLCCPCGGDADFKIEELHADHVRRNEAAYNVSKDGKSICTYMEHEDDRDVLFHCQDCDDYLCQKCHKAHGKRKKNKDHRCTEIEKMETISIKKWLKELYCQDHLDYKLELYDSTCKKSICIVCSHGKHNHTKTKDIDVVYEERIGTLDDVLRNYESRLNDIREVTQYIRKQQTEHDRTVNRLESEVASVHQEIAGKFLHRQKQLLQEIRQCIEGSQRAIQEKLKTVRTAEKTVLSTMDYIHRVMESTRKAELISLTSVIQKQFTEDLKIELPSDDTGDTRLTLSFQGRKALEEIVGEFGSLVSCIDNEEIVDYQPTIRALHLEVSDRSTKLARTSEELQKTAEELREAREIFPELQVFYSLQEQGISVHILTASQREIISSRLLSCPTMTLSREGINKDLAVSGENDQYLVNTVDSRTTSSPDKFIGCMAACRVPLSILASPSSLPIPQYWEANTRLQGKKRGTGLTLLEMGVVEELGLGQGDSGWTISVFDCCRHPGFCTQVWRKGRQVENGCLSNIPFPTADTDIEVKLGTLVDVGRGRLAFIDVNNGKVLHNFGITFSQSVYPVFGVAPLSLSGFETNMRLISGEEIIMSDSKKQSITEAVLSSNTLVDSLVKRFMPFS